MQPSQNLLQQDFYRPEAIPVAQTPASKH